MAAGLCSAGPAGPPTPTRTPPQIASALADEAVNTQIEMIADENTAPVGPTFTEPPARPPG